MCSIFYITPLISLFFTFYFGRKRWTQICRWRSSPASEPERFRKRRWESRCRKRSTGEEERRRSAGEWRCGMIVVFSYQWLLKKQKHTYGWKLGQLWYRIRIHTRHYWRPNWTPLTEHTLHYHHQNANRRKSRSARSKCFATNKKVSSVLTERVFRLKTSPCVKPPEEMLLGVCCSRGQCDLKYDPVGLLWVTDPWDWGIIRCENIWKFSIIKKLFYI